MEGKYYSYLHLEALQSHGPADCDRQPPSNLELKATRTTEGKGFLLSPSKKSFPTQQTMPFLLSSIGQLHLWLACGKGFTDSKLAHIPGGSHIVGAGPSLQPHLPPTYLGGFWYHWELSQGSVYPICTRTGLRGLPGDSRETMVEGPSL